MEDGTRKLINFSTYLECVLRMCGNEKKKYSGIVFVFVFLFFFMKNTENLLGFLFPKFVLGEFYWKKITF